ncbi:MAG: proline--tRNA ligase [Alphaproteobacteria bacterium]|nr:proline--tRNA ligase [Alphaproteobacteria bacterium]
MQLTRFFLPILKEVPADASIASHQLMLRAGLVRQLVSGIYSWLPLGLMVLRNIETIVREEMNRAGAIELLMPTIQPADLWKESGRYEDYGKEMLRIEDRHEHPLLYGPTNEEVITDIFRKSVRSYKDLPLNLYHVQWKFRDEVRPRFGVMRGREFLMKDAYSFDADQESAIRSYQTMFFAYINTFKRMGLTPIPVRADTGPIGGNLSHEFHILADTGESALYYDAAYEEMMLGDIHSFEQATSLYAAADEMHNPDNCPVPADRLKVRRGIEVGHIFNFGTKYSKALNAKVTTKEGKDVLVEMGSYGIGVSRLVGGIIEANHDQHGIIWPEPIAPFKVGILNLKQGDSACDAASEKLYQSLVSKNVSVLYDDRTEGAGSKFATQDLIGTPWHVAIGPRGLGEGVVEIKNRRTGEKSNVSVESALNHLI